MDATFVTSGGNGGPPAVARRPLVVVALGQSRNFMSSGPLVRGVEPTASVTIGKQFSTTSVSISAAPVSRR